MNDSLLSSGTAAAASTPAVATAAVGGSSSGGKTIRKRTRFSPSPQPEGTLFACDNCFRYPLETVRHRCRVCPEFDLCEECFVSKVHQHHEFMPVPISATITSSSSQMYGAATHHALVSLTASAEAAAKELPPLKPDVHASMNPFVQKMTMLLDEVKVKIPLLHYNPKAGEEFMAIFDQSRTALASTKSQIPTKVLEQILVRTALAQLGSKALKSPNNFQFMYEPEPAGLFTLMQGLLLQFLGSSSAPKNQIRQLYLEMTTNPEFDKDFPGFFDWVKSGMADYKSALCFLGLGELREALLLFPESPNGVGNCDDVQVLQTMNSKLADAKVRIPMRERSVGFAQRFLSYCQSDEPALVRTAVILAGGNPLRQLLPLLIDRGDDGIDSLLLLFLNQVKSFDNTQRLDVPKGVYFVNREISQDLFCKCVEKVLGEITEDEARDRCSSAFRDLLQSLGIQLVDMEPKPAMATTTTAVSSSGTTSTEGTPQLTPPLQQEEQTEPKADTIVAPTITTTELPIAVVPSKEANDMRALAVKLRKDLENAHARIDMLALLLKESLAAPLLYGLDKVGRH
ncbi:hypothetical protein BASA81_003777 [Batrachochytrium salamandrivorans]|nr:hypothetical protein BASA81_003777 [Batrachochytrium salamandrivorans]